MKYILLFSMVLTSQSLVQVSKKTPGLSGKGKTKTSMIAKRASRKAKSKYWRVCDVSANSNETQA